jgi:hypothetical protein
VHDSSTPQVLILNGDFHMSLTISSIKLSHIQQLQEG